MDPPPPDFRSEREYVGNVCRLKKSLDGLKQSSRSSRFSSTVLSMGFNRCHSNHICFFKQNKYTLLLVYVDDIIITGDDEEGVYVGLAQGYRHDWM